MKQICFKVDGEWFTDFIRNLYYNENNSLEECKNKLIKCLNLDSILEEEEKNELIEAILFGSKKFIGTNSFELIDDKEFNIYDYCHFSKPDFSKAKYAVGILTRDGIFVQCKYQQHEATIRCIGLKKARGALVFHRDIFGNEFYVSKDNNKIKTTKYQRKWIKNNLEHLTPEQIHDIKGFYKDEGLNIKEEF